MNSTSWKTTTAGVISIVGAAWLLWEKRASLDGATVIGAATAIMTGVGLIFARDNDVSSAAIAQKKTDDVPPFRPPLWIIGALLAVTLGTGCLLPKGSIAPGADPIAVQAEALAETAGDSMHAFVSWELRNRSGVGQDVTAAADLVREFGPGYLRELKAATRTYKASRTRPNADATRAAIEALQGLLEQARNYYQPQGTP